MSQSIGCIFGALGLSLALIAPAALAQDAPVRVRGAIERVEGDTYVVKARNGTEQKVKLPDNVMVVALIKASLADIKQGSYVGVSGMPQADGSSEMPRNPHLSRSDARHRRRTSSLGPAAVEHHDQRSCRADVCFG